MRRAGGEIVFHGGDWRPRFRDFLRGARDDLAVVCPFIREKEARFVVDNAGAKNVTAIVDARGESVAGGALEIKALQTLAARSREGNVFHLDRLHAKVYVADDSRAIVTSANLTAGGLDRNYEFGVEIIGEDAAKARRHIEELRRIAAPLFAADLAEMKKIAEKIRAVDSDFRARREDALRPLIRELESLRGESAESASMPSARDFNFAVLDALREGGPLRAEEIHERLTAMFPRLRLSEAKYHGKRDYGLRWKREARNAMQRLKRRGDVLYDPKRDVWILNRSD